jgi:sugar/nucleoside kinase (ribokinase family)
VSHDLVVLGDLVADLIVPIERLPLEPNKHGWAEGIFVEPGGAGNVLVAGRRVGLAIASLGHVGGDRYGEDLVRVLEAEGVDMREVAVCPDRDTVLCIVLTDTLHQHVYLGIQDDKGVWPFPERWHQVIREGRALYTDGYTLRDVIAPDNIFAALATAREAGVPNFFDPGPSVEFIPRPILERVFAAVDTVFIAEPEAAHLFPGASREDAARSLLALGPSLVVVKLGGEGCLLATREEISHVPGFAVPVVDTVGAGDSFAPAFIAGLLRGGSLQDAATLANAMGAVVVTRRGAGTRIPPRDELLALLADHPARALSGGDEGYEL